MTLQKFSKALDEAFEDYAYGESPRELYEPIQYILSLGGKRFRPQLTLISAALFTPDWEKAIKPAMAVEVFHNFTLMHDDIMDQAPLRRGKQTVHTQWDTNRAILSGDVMLVAAYELMMSLPDQQLRQALRRFNRTAAEVCEGQQLDMLFAEKAGVSKEDYLEMIRLKTSVLLGFACELGGIVAGQDENTCQKLFDIGVNMGLGFQQMDDVLDVWADAAKFGKQVGGDIIENKKTWLVLRAFEKAKGTQFEHDLKTLFSEKDPEKKVNGVRAVFNHLQIREEGIELANAYFQKAEVGLNDLKVSHTAMKSLFYEFLEIIKKRDK